jgi:elongation factor G
LLQLRAKLRLNAAPIHVPIGLEDRFEGVIDVITMEAVYFEGANGETIVKRAIPDHLAQKAATARADLVGALADVDEHIAEKFLADQPITEEELKQAIRRQTMVRKFTPVMMGSALKNKGVQLLLNGVRDYLPNPSERHNFAFQPSNPSEKVEMIIDRTRKLPFVGYAFKLDEGKFGQLTYMRLYQGSLRRGEFITNIRDGKRIKVSRLVRMHSNEMEDVDEVLSGEICAIMGLECATGDTFTDGTVELAMQSMFVPDPVIALAVFPERKEDLDRFSKALQRFQKEDPTFRVHVDPESKEVGVMV